MIVRAEQTQINSFIRKTIELIRENDADKDFVAENEKIGLFIEPDAIHIMKKSEYSGQFGDYSTFSDEIDELSIVDDEE